MSSSASFRSPPSPPRRKGGGNVKLVIAILGILAAVLSVVAGILEIEHSKTTQKPPPAQAPENPRPGDQFPPDSHSGSEPTPSYTTRSYFKWTVRVGEGVDMDRSSGSADDGDYVYEMVMDQTQLLLSFPATIEVMVLESGNPTYETCSEATNYVRGDKLPYQTLPDGTKMCLKTSVGRIAAIARLLWQPDSVTFDAVVYDPPHE
jgi:hypothetical protein